MQYETLIFEVLGWQFTTALTLNRSLSKKTMQQLNLLLNIDSLFAALAGIIGLLVGSFLNVVIYRYNTGLSIVKGRSKCLSCGKTLDWYELIPLFSFLFLKGKCLGCKSKISKQYFNCWRVAILNSFILFRSLI